jgi:glutamine amidotransferase
VTVAIIDYGAGNLHSVCKAVAAVGATPHVLTDPRDLSPHTALIVPGVGHFDATRALGADWRDAIGTRLDAGASLLGICLGMQWLFEGSDEAPDLPGFGVLPGRCTRLAGDVTQGIKVPHVGWNTLTFAPTCPPALVPQPPGHPYAYFTHTYAAPITDDTAAVTTHGRAFASVVARGRILGAQWHPEKSGHTGLALLHTFMTMARTGGAAC